MFRVLGCRALGSLGFRVLGCRALGSFGFRVLGFRLNFLLPER